MTLGSTMYVSSMFFVILCMPCSSRYFFKEIYSRSKKTAKKILVFFSFHCLCVIFLAIIERRLVNSGDLHSSCYQLFCKSRETVNVV